MGFFDLFKSGPKHIFNENGENIIYFENENIVKCKFTKVNGSINGSFLTFYKNIGQTRCMSAEFKNGKLEGSSYEYSITAKMNWIEEEYSNNNVISKKVFYTGFSNRGKLAKDEKYKVEDEADGVIKEGVYTILNKYNISNKICEDKVYDESNLQPKKIDVKNQIKTKKTKPQVLEVTSKEDAKNELMSLKEYLDLGIITQEEFDKKAVGLKKILLGD